MATQAVGDLSLAVVDVFFMHMEITMMPAVNSHAPLAHE